MQLKQLLTELHPVSVEGSVEREIMGIGYDSRRITPGMIFVALPGHHTDGHEYIHSAIDRGATAVICERNGFVPLRATKIKVTDGREALALASAAFYEHPSTKLKLIGVTGTNGKTTVAFMVKQILEASGIKTGLIGTVRYEIGDRIFPAHRTTPEALEVQQMLAQMLRAGCQACVMEVSSHALEQKRVQGVEFDVGIFTNLTRDHLDYHGTMENYFSAKKLLFQALEQGTKRGGVVINIDDAFGERLARESRAEVQLTYGIAGTAKLRATAIQLSPAGTDMTVETPAGQFACRLPLVSWAQRLQCLGGRRSWFCLAHRSANHATRSRLSRASPRTLGKDPERPGVCRLRRLCAHRRRVAERVANLARDHSWKTIVKLWLWRKSRQRQTGAHGTSGGGDGGFHSDYE